MHKELLEDYLFIYYLLKFQKERKLVLTLSPHSESELNLQGWEISGVSLSFSAQLYALQGYGKELLLSQTLHLK